MTQIAKHFKVTKTFVGNARKITAVWKEKNLLHKYILAKTGMLK